MAESIHEITPVLHRLVQSGGDLMKKQRALGAVLAAASGLGFASGRGVAVFYTQTGWASWLGIAAASAVFGCMCAAVCLMARQTGARTLSGAFLRLSGKWTRLLFGVFYGLLTALTAGWMVAAAGSAAALSLPFYNAWWLGAAASLMTALLLCMGEMRGMGDAGICSVCLCILFAVFLAIDPRPVRFYQKYVTVAELSGSVSAALKLAVLHGCACASIASGSAAVFASETENIREFGIKVGTGMFVMLGSVNAAVMRGGKEMISQAMPIVVLAARWGKTGFYTCAALMWLTSTMTLAACIGAWIGGFHPAKLSKPDDVENMT